MKQSLTYNNILIDTDKYFGFISDKDDQATRKFNLFEYSELSRNASISIILMFRDAFTNSGHSQTNQVFSLLIILFGYFWWFHFHFIFCLECIRHIMAMLIEQHLSYMTFIPIFAFMILHFKC